ncbi:unnamed protein product [Didymodactylos carnosus]|uniref:Eukaryotic translation initiation factor 4E type 3 n=1 Tax=Didymodactylos carnosus TaxID=1234261 RepID=A0A813UAY1_9BILA|nr:unnamed protein product [Didymodactylos carnosus]CAF0938195.1 unnamed protein product [Didymodactylos carnosus]CAF3609953.1 unnamed protein product [Didymodactylos carnosus]CAF3713657.1 unnamed protein product [Didymodactylos carnosus]
MLSVTARHRYTPVPIYLCEKSASLMLDDENSSIIDGGDRNKTNEHRLLANKGEVNNNNNYLAKICQSLSLTTVEQTAPLASSWTFWLLDNQKLKTTSKNDYESGLSRIYEVATVQEFWSVFNNIPAPSKLLNRVSYHLMRNNRKPLWEDAENINGGIWTAKCSKHFINAVWQDLCLATIGEQFEIDNDNIVGVTVQTRDGQYDVIQIWNSNSADDSHTIISNKVMQLFPDMNFPVKFYKANSSHKAFEGQQTTV